MIPLLSLKEGESMRKRILIIFCMFFVLMLGSISETGAINKGKVTLTYQNSEYTLSDIDVLLYKIASYDIKNLGKITLLDDYQDSHLDLSDIDHQDVLKEKTKSLKQYIDKHALKENQLIKADNQGKAVFKDLDDGIYLIQGRYRGNDYDVSIEPTLIVMPSVYDQQFVYQYDLHPKMTIQKRKQYQDYTVLKVWKDHNNKEHLRPQAIKVGLYANKKLVQTVKLDATSNWSYTWNHLDSTKNWSVKEINMNRNYTSHVKQTNNQFVIENEIKDTTHIKTGDYQPIIIFMILFLISAIMLIYWCIKKKNE